MAQTKASTKFLRRPPVMTPRKRGHKTAKPACTLCGATGMTLHEDVCASCADARLRSMASTAQDNGADAAPSMPAEPEADHTALAFVATVSSSVAALTPPDACFVCGITLTEPHHNGRCQDCWGYYRTEGKDRSMVVTEIPVTDDELDRLPDIPKATPDAFKISQKSLVVFLAYAQQADHHGRTALQMKRAERTSLRLLRTGNFITIEDHDGQAWVCFTATGKALALAHGIDLDAGKAGVDAPPSSLRAP